MRNNKIKIICVLILLVFMAGCLPGAAVDDRPRPPTLPQSQAGPESAQNPSAAPQALTVLLPRNEETLAAALQQAARENDIELTVLNSKTNEEYSLEAQKALGEATRPDLVFVQNSTAFAALEGHLHFVDLQGAQTPPALQAVAAMAPQNGRLWQNDVYGLPVGYGAQGTLVNLEVLAQLLGAQNQTALLADLTACSWRQWRSLLLGLEQYLAKPGRMQITLAGTVYTTAAFRPKSAQPLRGMFALADTNAEALVKQPLEAALYAVQQNTGQAFEALEEESQTALMQQALQAALWGLEFETLHMARGEGVVFRGEAYAQSWAKLNPSQAEDLLVQGTALLLRGNSAQGLRLEAEHPQLSGKLALLPNKLPPAQGIAGAEEDAATDESHIPAENDKNTGNSENGNIDIQKMAENAVKQQNTQLLAMENGYLCLTNTGAQNPAATALLLQLFAGQQPGQALGQATGQWVFTQAAPQSTLLAQVAGAVGAQGGFLATPGRYNRAEEIIGAHLRDELLQKDTWGNEEVAAWLNTAYVALGLRVEAETQAD